MENPPVILPKSVAPRATNPLPQDAPEEPIESAFLAQAANPGTGATGLHSTGDQSRRAARKHNRQRSTSGLVETLPPGDAQDANLQSDVAEANAQVEAFQLQLEEKEQLIIALTDRLEQAAEQLDRLRRTGADRGARRSGGGGLPPELVEDHRAVVEDLKQVITRWEDMQAAVTLGRLESQVSELRDLVAGYVTSTPSSRPGLESAVRPATSSKGAGPGTWWEAQKAALLGEAPPPGPIPDRDTADETECSPALLESNLPDLPPAVDFENLTLDDARLAIRERDSVINSLREPLLLLQASGNLPQNLGSLENIPDAVRQRIDALESAWQAKFRQAELDLSLERARLARAEAAVHQQQDQNRQHDSAAAADKDYAGRASKKEAAEGGNQRRWFRFLGNGHTAEVDEEEE